MLCVCVFCQLRNATFIHITGVNVWAAVVTHPAPFASCPGKQSVSPPAPQGGDRLGEVFSLPNAEPGAIPLKFLISI